MCGILGGIGVSAPSKQLLDAQLKSIEHRGPDDSGTYLNQEISLGMCRLAIVEIAAGNSLHLMLPKKSISSGTVKSTIIVNFALS